MRTHTAHKRVGNTNEFVAIHNLQSYDPDKPFIGYREAEQRLWEFIKWCNSKEVLEVRRRRLQHEETVRRAKEHFSVIEIAAKKTEAALMNLGKAFQVVNKRMRDFLKMTVLHEES